MASEVGIVNSAGIKIGAKQRIISFEDGTPLANLGADRYHEIRDELLRGHPWNFAEDRAKLARSSETPEFKYAYKYALPTGWMRTVAVYDNDAGVGWVDYKEEKGFILSNAEDIYLVFVFQVTDPNLMTPDFRECIAMQLASEGAIPIVQSKSLSEKWEKRFDKQLIKAKSNDSQGDKPDRRPDGSWTSRRFRSSGFSNWGS